MQFALYAVFVCTAELQIDREIGRSMHVTMQTFQQGEVGPTEQ